MYKPEDMINSIPKEELEVTMCIGCAEDIIAHVTDKEPLCLDCFNKNTTFEDAFLTNNIKDE